MHILQGRVARAGCAAIALLILTTVQVHSATPNTIRQKYGLQLKQDVVPLQSELLRVQRTIRSTQEIALYNKVLSESTTEQLDVQIGTLSNKANSLYASVKGGIDTPLAKLMAEESEYDSTVEQLNKLLGARDFRDWEALPTPDVDIAELQKKEAGLASKIAKGGHYQDIGSMSYYPVIDTAYHVNSKFGPRYDPVGIRGYAFHYGIDLKAKKGTPIGAWFSGTVASTGNSKGSGLYIWLDHGNGLKTFYCHLSRVDVKEGQNVKQGTQIALSGDTGIYVTGPHLHLGLYIDGTAVDPQVILE